MSMFKKINKKIDYVNYFHIKIRIRGFLTVRWIENTNSSRLKSSN